MTKPTTVIVAGAAGLIFLTLVVRHFRSSDEGPEAQQQRAAQSLAFLPRPNNGWNVREGSDGSPMDRGSDGQPLRGATGRNATGGSGPSGSSGAGSRGSGEPV